MLDREFLIASIKKTMSQEGIDGWLLYDFRRSNDLACRFLAIPSTQMLTRRFFYWIPIEGPPVKIVSRVEEHVLDHLPGEKRLFASWQDLENRLAEILLGHHRVAMEFSPRCSVPYLSKVDGGTIDLVRSFGVDVVSSGNLLQQATSTWDDEKQSLHRQAALVLEEAVNAAWALITESLIRGRPIYELEVQEFIIHYFDSHHCTTSSSPICAVNAHSANPHFCAGKEQNALIRKGDFILIDLWCKKQQPHAVYADITRVGVAASAPTARQQEIFNIVKQTQEEAFNFLCKRIVNDLPVMGWEVDQVCRRVIAQAGYGDFFVHRTGHNIDEEDHGDGAHIDSLETLDTRRLIPNTCFSIEPGIYIPGEFGVRLEYDVFIPDSGLPIITTGSQHEILPLCC